MVRTASYLHITEDNICNPITGVTGPLREAVKVWWSLSGLRMRLVKEKMQAQLKKQEMS